MKSLHILSFIDPLYSFNFSFNYFEILMDQFTLLYKWRCPLIVFFIPSLIFPFKICTISWLVYQTKNILLEEACSTAISGKCLVFLLLAFSKSHHMLRSLDGTIVSSLYAQITSNDISFIVDNIPLIFYRVVNEIMS